MLIVWGVLAVFSPICSLVKTIIDKKKTNKNIFISDVNAI